MIIIFLPVTGQVFGQVTFTCINNNARDLQMFDANPSLDVRLVFRDLLKAFDRVWHDSLMYKLMSLGTLGTG